MLDTARRHLDPFFCVVRDAGIAGPAGERVTALLGAFRDVPGAFDAYLNFAPAGYTRNLVHREAAFEILLLCWAPGARSAIHDHGGERCYMTVLEGALSVDDFVIRAGGRRPGFADIAPIGTTLMLPGDVDARTSQRDIHRVSALQVSVSLHLYAKPLDRFMVFDERAQSCRMVAGCYDRMPDQAAS